MEVAGKWKKFLLVLIISVWGGMIDRFLGRVYGALRSCGGFFILMEGCMGGHVDSE